MTRSISIDGFVEAIEVVDVIQGAHLSVCLSVCLSVFVSLLCVTVDLCSTVADDLLFSEVKMFFIWHCRVSNVRCGCTLNYRRIAIVDVATQNYR